MAAYRRQSKLYWGIPLLLPGALSSGTALAKAEKTEPVLPASGYEQTVGEQFFLLADTGFGSSDIATVRLEAPGRSGAVAEYGGVDLAVYRVPDPMAFLKAQRNLHRIRLNAKYQGEGLANTLGFVWDNWFKTSRLAWQRLFSGEARSKVVEVAPNLNQAHPSRFGPRFSRASPYQPMPGFEMVSRFRYPLQHAKAIQPPAGVTLEGSSSSFLEVSEGNVRVPLGRLAPGLYVVEAWIGGYRATTLVFVADTVAVTKISGSQLLVWTADKRNGRPAARTELAWTDGAGTLLAGRTDDQGLLTLDKASPEHSYVLGRDSAGGVFVSENFYYDSEIHAAKLLAVTDRPLYRPGDEVHVKLIGREFTDALHSRPLAAGPVDVQVLDANGTPLFSKRAQFKPADGADLDFRLPVNAGAGGYQLRSQYQGKSYNAAFRVAQYVKPHYEISLVPDKAQFRTGEPVTGTIKLNYPDGKSVANAALTLTVKAQTLAMVDDRLDYTGQLPIKLDDEGLKTDRNGTARFSLPAAKEPSRYLLSLLSSDQSAYRVATTKELLIQAGQARYRLRAGKQYSSPGETVGFSAEATTGQAADGLVWEAQRLEDRTTQRGDVNGPFSIAFAQPGSYTVRVLDRSGNLLGATSHWVSGPGQQVTPGSISIVFDKPQYAPGETAHALISFDRPMDEALLTLERDKVAASALLSGARGWVNARRLAPTQWQADIPVQADYGPNMTFSVLTVKDNQYQFQNRGLLVRLPRVALAVKPDKASYAPGDTVTVDVDASVDGKPAPARLVVSVVDEMVYALQPEIGPDVFDFFYHVRRNNVRTSTSLNFHSYDMATSPKVGPPVSSRHYDRPFKVMERPRREDRDTAAWLPGLATDASGHARFSFRMPDSLTRWRVTVRAQTSTGVVGQATSGVLSDKPLYLKWIGPRQYRTGDQPGLAVAVFNAGTAPRAVELSAEGLDAPFTRQIEAAPGASYVTLPVTMRGDRQLTVRARADGREIDALAGTLDAVPAGWPGRRTAHLTLSGASTPLTLPADAGNLSLALGADNTRDALLRVMEDLIAYPYGCVEQTASRLIPLTLALDSLPASPEALPLIGQLEQRLQSGRLRLVQLAGPNAHFSWWGNQAEGSALLTAYAYYADQRAARRLGITLPADHGKPVLDAYNRYAGAEPLFNRAIILWLMQRMNLPTQTLAAGLASDIAKSKPPAVATVPATQSLVMTDRELPLNRAMTVALLAQIARQNKTAALPPGLQKEVAPSLALLRAGNLPLARALALLANGTPDAEEAGRILDQIGPDQPTIDRSLSLIWIDAALAGQRLPARTTLSLAAPWQPARTPLGSTVWRYQGAVKPTAVQLAAAPVKPLPAQLQYDTAEPDKHDLNLKVQRKLYRLKPGKEALSFSAEAITGPWALKNSELYVDELTLSPGPGERFRFGLLEVPLPPGADVEATTWGLKIDGLSGGAATVNAKTHEAGELSYVVPVANLQKPLVVRHLLRFSQLGRFTVPPARYWRMYRPDKKAFEGSDALASRSMEVK